MHSGYRPACLGTAQGPLKPTCRGPACRSSGPSERPTPPIAAGHLSDPRQICPCPQPPLVAARFDLGLPETQPSSRRRGSVWCDRQVTDRHATLRRRSIHGCRSIPAPAPSSAVRSPAPRPESPQGRTGDFGVGPESPGPQRSAAAARAVATRYSRTNSLPSAASAVNAPARTACLDAKIHTVEQRTGQLPRDTAASPAGVYASAGRIRTQAPGVGGHRSAGKRAGGTTPSRRASGSRLQREFAAPPTHWEP